MSDTGTEVVPAEDTEAPAEGEVREGEVEGYQDPYAQAGLIGTPIYPANDPLNGAWDEGGGYSPTSESSEEGQAALAPGQTGQQTVQPVQPVQPGQEGYQEPQDVS